MAWPGAGGAGGGGRAAEVHTPVVAAQSAAQRSVRGSAAGDTADLLPVYGTEGLRFES
jgi:hypothetical protein